MPSKTLYGHTLGANINEKEASQSVKVVPDNKTILALPLNEEPDTEAIPKRLKSMKEIFATYQPEKEVVLKNNEGHTEDVVLKFNSLKDFTKEGIIKQSQLLQDIQENELIYSRFSDILQTNEKLKTVLSNPESKTDFIDLLNVLIEELENEND